VQAVHLADDLAGGDVQRREQGCRAVALVVVRTPSRDVGMPGAIGSCGCVRSPKPYAFLSHAPNDVLRT
jgi:hypothetical protein